MIVDRENDLHSIGRLVEMLQASPGQVERAADQAGVAPALRLNGVAYFADSAIASIRARLEGASTNGDASCN